MESIKSFIKKKSIYLNEIKQIIIIYISAYYSCKVPNQSSFNIISWLLVKARASALAPSNPISLPPK